MRHMHVIEDAGSFVSLFGTDCADDTDLVLLVVVAGNQAPDSLLRTILRKEAQAGTSQIQKNQIASRWEVFCPSMWLSSYGLIGIKLHII